MPFTKLSARDPLRDLQAALRQAIGDPPHVHLDEVTHRYHLRENGSELPSVGSIVAKVDERGKSNGYDRAAAHVLHRGQRVHEFITAAELMGGFSPPPDDLVAPFVKPWQEFKALVGWRTLAAEHSLCGLAPLTSSRTRDIFKAFEVAGSSSPAAPPQQHREASRNGTNAPGCSAPCGVPAPQGPRREAPPPTADGGGAPLFPYAGTPDLIGVMTSPPPWLGRFDLYVLELKTGSIPGSAGPQSGGYLLAAHQLLMMRSRGDLRIAGGALCLPPDDPLKIERRRWKGDERRRPLIMAAPDGFVEPPDVDGAAQVGHFRPVAQRDLEEFIDRADAMRWRDTFTGGDADPQDLESFEPPVMPGDGVAFGEEATP